MFILNKWRNLKNNHAENINVRNLCATYVYIYFILNISINIGNIILKYFSL